MDSADVVVVEGVKLVRRVPTGWQTVDGSHEVVERRRGQWEARDPKGKSIAKAGTRSGVLRRLKSVLTEEYTGGLPCVVG